MIGASLSCPSFLALVALLRAQGIIEKIDLPEGITMSLHLCEIGVEVQIHEAREKWQQGQKMFTAWPEIEMASVNPITAIMAAILAPYGLDGKLERHMA